MQFFATAPAISKNYTRYKSVQNWLQNNWLANNNLNPWNSLYQELWPSYTKISNHYFFLFFLSLFEPLKFGIFKKFKARVHLLAGICVSKHASVFPVKHFLLHNGHDSWHTLSLYLTLFYYFEHNNNKGNLYCYEFIMCSVIDDLKFSKSIKIGENCGIA